jgi:FtsP/CotA-like multicopper oxidase with cupredoxin domain
MKKFTRREVLKLTGATGLFVAGGSVISACTNLPAGAPAGSAQQPASTPSQPQSSFIPDLDIALKATRSEVQLLNGKPTNVWAYQGSVVKGDPSAVQAVPGSYLGPIIRARAGQKVRITFANDLPGQDEETIIHWHGLHLPEDMDSHPRYSIAQGKSYVYEFEIEDRAATYWFHPHPHERTAQQVMAGLAGLFIVTDEEEAALNLPSGEFDAPIIIQDRTFDADNQFVYLNGTSMSGKMGTMMGGNQGMAGMNHGNMGSMGGNAQSGESAMGMGDMADVRVEQMMGFLGQRVLVNGRPDFVLPVATRAYRLRLLNGSNARIYKLAWSDGTPITVIGTDGGLLEKPAQRPFVMLAPGERLDVWADFQGRKIGDEVRLESLAFTGAEGDMSGMMHSSSNAPELGAPMQVMTVRVEREVSETAKLPERLSTIQRLRVEEAVNAKSPRTFRLTHQQMVWQINDRTFDMDAVADDEKVKMNTTEVWEFINDLNPGEMMDPMGMAHPFHIHGRQFQVIERQVLSELKAGWDGVREGYVDDGWKDTVLLMPGERVKLAMQFRDYTGTYVFHCHNLEHESQGMMRNYQVIS